MDLKKVKEKNPGWQFSKKISSKAAKSVLDAATKSKLDIDSYNLKYAAKVKSKKRFSETSTSASLKDKTWRMMKKESVEKSTDSLEEKKAGFYDAEGNEVASQG